MRNVYRFYLACYFTVTLLASVAVVLVTTWADPYGLYRPLWLDRPLRGIDAFTRLVKPHLVARVKPVVLIAGSSRAELSLDPRLVEAALGMRPAFNASLPACNAYELARNVNHAMAVAPVRTLIIGLDFFMFNENSPNKPGFDESRLAVRVDGRPNWAYVWRDLPATLLSFDALNHSRAAMQNQSQVRGCESYWRVDGFRVHDAIECLIAKPGMQISRFQDYLSAQLTVDWGYRHFTLDERPLPSNSLRNVEAVLSLRAENTVLYISPIHALELLLIEDAGLWSDFERWKRLLAEITWRAQREGQNVQLLDFTGINEVNGSPLDFRDGRATAAFHDASHLRPTYNGRLVDALVRRADDEWGRELSPPVMDSVLAKERWDLAEWKSTHPEHVVFLQETVRGAVK